MQESDVLHRAMRVAVSEGAVCPLALPRGYWETKKKVTVQGRGDGRD